MTLKMECAPASDAREVKRNQSTTRAVSPSYVLPSASLDPYSDSSTKQNADLCRQGWATNGPIFTRRGPIDAGLRKDRAHRFGMEGRTRVMATSRPCPQHNAFATG